MLWALCKDQPRSRGAVEHGRPQADLFCSQTGRGKGHMGALTEVPSPESLDAEGLISKSAGPMAGL